MDLKEKYKASEFTFTKKRNASFLPISNLMVVQVYKCIGKIHKPNGG